jgi:hypothetical protein
MSNVFTSPVTFKFSDFNPRRKARGVEAVRMEVYEGEKYQGWLWMSRRDIEKNIKLHGAQPALLEGLKHYGGVQ